MIVQPDDVTSPLDHWKIDQVVFNGGPGPNTHSVAIGLWEGKPTLVMRWNGSEERPKGNPVSTGYPTWFVIPSQYHRAIIDTLNLSEEVQRRCRAFLGLD